MSSTPKAPDPALAPEGSEASAAAASEPTTTPPSRFGGLTGRGLYESLFNQPSFSVLIAVALVLVLLGIAHPSFFSLGQIQDVLQGSVYVGVIACGMAFLIAMRLLDLSVSSILALSAGVAALLMNQGWNPWLAALAALVAGAAMGAFNGFLVVTIRINALLATLATLYVYNGLNQGLTGSNTVILGYTNSDAPIKGNHAATSSFFTAFNGNFLSIPIAAWLMLGFATVLTLILVFTPFGYRVRSIGSNPEAAEFSGISIPRVTYQAFILVGIVTGLAGLLILLFFKAADPSVGGADNLLAIAAVIIGGTPMRGGSGTVFGAMIGAILLTGLVQSALPYFNIPDDWTQFALGSVILVAVAVDSILRASRRRGVVSR
jgi:ribose transport system permease protein